MTSKTIIVHKEGSKETLLIDAHTGNILTAQEDRPSWHDGEIVALLAERSGYYAKTIGKVPETDIMNYEDLGWLGLDAEGDEVEIEADAEWRMQNVADILGIDRSADNFDAELKGQLATATVHMEQVQNPTAEITLGEAEGKTFEEVEKKAVTG